jgi:primosomal protein N' (replication factor Y)
MGVGTQRIEEDLKELLPEVKTARFDLDSTRKKHAFHNLIQDFESQRIDILIGTQMVTKGLDFENVGLVGILNADQIMGFPDFRSFERAFQTLTQVSGRAGRKKKRGKVVIQTYNAEHPVIQYVVNRDFEQFLQTELVERKNFHYPPYYRMMEIRLKFHDRQILFTAATALGKDLKRVFGGALLGPEFPFIERVRNKYSMHFILRFDKSLNVQSAKKKLGEILASFTALDNFRNIKFQFDIDPY